MVIEKYVNKELIVRSIDLTNILGVFELAWTFHDVMEVLKVLQERNIIVLGGDVLSKDLSYIGDNWYYEGKDYIGSIQHTRKYINSYYQNNGNDYYYVLVIQE